MPRFQGLYILLPYAQFSRGVTNISTSDILSHFCYSSRIIWAVLTKQDELNYSCNFEGQWRTSLEYKFKSFSSALQNGFLNLSRTLRSSTSGMANKSTASIFQTKLAYYLGILTKESCKGGVAVVHSLLTYEVSGLIPRFDIICEKSLLGVSLDLTVLIFSWFSGFPPPQNQTRL